MTDKHGSDGPAELGARIHRGDPDAFEQMFRCYYEPLCRYSHRYVGSMAAAEDIVQDLFVRLWERRADWRPDSIRKYLYASVRSRSLSAIERGRRQVVFDTETDSSPAGGSTDGGVRYEELRRQVQGALAQLSSRQREIFYLSRNADLSHQEIADVLGLSVHTVAVHMGRALQKLREHLKEHPIVHL